jgi:para-aminobenzoate synthetase/4-amino-4-deoxychorismate lyase
MPDSDPAFRPRLTFDFRGALDSPQPRLVFERPIEVLEAGRLDQVLPLLDRVDAACRAGRWAAGFLSYEAAPAFDPAFRTRTPGRLPLAWFGIFESAAEPREETPAGPTAGIDWRPDIDRDAYRTALASIRAAIERGET